MTTKVAKIIALFLTAFLVLVLGAYNQNINYLTLLGIVALVEAVAISAIRDEPRREMNDGEIRLSILNTLIDHIENYEHPDECEDCPIPDLLKAYGEKTP